VYTNVLLKVMEADIFPEIGRFELPVITPQLLVHALELVAARHGTEQAHRICSLCGDVFTYGIVARICETNPANIARTALPPRTYQSVPIALTPDQLRMLVANIGAYSISPIIRGVLRLSLLSLVRPGELCRAEWKDIDWKNAVWRYELSRPAVAQRGWRYHYVPLCEHAIRTLLDLQVVTGEKRFIFTTSQSWDKPIEPSVLLRALRGVGLNRGGARSNPFRAVARRLLVETLGMPADVVDQQLGHAFKVRVGCEVNCQSCLAERRQVMQVWSDYLDSLMLA
jgi:integrase